MIARRMGQRIRALSGENGQAMVEFSLVLPVVLLLLLGILQVGLVLNARQTVENAARVAADAYARTLSTDQADREAIAAADQLRPRLLRPVATTTYTVIGERRSQQQRTLAQQVPRQVCERTTGFFTPRLTCRTVFEVTTTTQTSEVTSRAERGASAADPGRVGELVRATIHYSYPLPVVGVFARIGFPTTVPLTGEAISLIEARTPASAGAGCYEVVRSFETFGAPIDLSATVNGSRAARIRARSASDQLVEIVASPGHALRQYGPVPGDQTVKRETIRLLGAAQAVSAEDWISWRIYQSSTVSYRYRATVTLRPASDGSCGASGQR